MSLNMKKSTNRFSTQRWDNFAADANGREDDLLLAELQTIPDDTGLTITPLNHIVDDEDAIDKLLADSGFDAAGKQPPFIAAEPVIEPADLIDHRAGIVVDEQNEAIFSVESLPEEPLPEGFQVDAFISDYLAVRQPGHSTDPAPESIKDFVLPAEPAIIESMQSKPGDAVIAEQATDTMIDAIAKEAVVQRKKPEPLKQAQTTNTGNAIPVIEQLQINQASIEKRLGQLQKQSSAAIRLAYASLALAIAILMSTVVLYTTISDMKTDISKVSEWVQMLKEAMVNAVEKTLDDH